MKHKKHDSHPHDKVAAMPQFNEGHWQKSVEDVAVGGGRYSAEMNEASEYKHQADALAGYAKKHRMKY